MQTQCLIYLQRNVLASCRSLCARSLWKRVLRLVVSACCRTVPGEGVGQRPMTSSCKAVRRREALLSDCIWNSQCGWNIDETASNSRVLVHPFYCCMLVYWWNWVVTRDCTLGPSRYNGYRETRVAIPEIVMLFYKHWNKLILHSTKFQW